MITFDQTAHFCFAYLVKGNLDSDECVHTPGHNV
jgi:hypothetical protein